MKQFIDKLIERLEKERCKLQDAGYCYGLEDAIKIINQLAEEFATDINVASNGWIACSERLPELNEEVLVTQFFDDSKHYNVTNASLISVLDGSGRVRWCSYDHFITHVIAWQPLPAPYQPKGE